MPDLLPLPRVRGRGEQGLLAATGLSRSPPKTGERETDCALAVSSWRIRNGEPSIRGEELPEASGRARPKPPRAALLRSLPYGPCEKGTAWKVRGCGGHASDTKKESYATG